MEWILLLLIIGNVLFNFLVSIWIKCVLSVFNGLLFNLFCCFVFLSFVIGLCESVVFFVIMLLIWWWIRLFVIEVIFFLFKLGVIFNISGLYLLNFWESVVCFIFNDFNKLFNVLLYCKLCRFLVFGEEIFMVI